MKISLFVINTLDDELQCILVIDSDSRMYEYTY